MGNNKRLAPDPAIAVLDLQKCIKDFCQEKGSQDMWALVVPHESRKVSWKTVPDPAWLCVVGPLINKFARLTKNLVLSSKKLKAALLKVQYLGMFSARLCFNVCFHQCNHCDTFPV